MESPLYKYWQFRLQSLQKRLEANNFDVYVAQDIEEATNVVIDRLIPECNPKTVSYGGSMTLQNSRILDLIEKNPDISLLRADNPNLSGLEKMELRRQALLVDLYLAGTNAITEDGHLVNLDMIGNRTGAITFGPRKVVLLVGRNKIVPDLDTAMYRIKDYVAPTNAIRLDFKIPCTENSECADCNSPSRICNTWSVTEKSFPKKRIAVLLINQDLGL